MWIDEHLLREWQGLDVRNKPIFEKFYPDEVIEFCLLLSSHYHQKLRQTVGLVKNILALCGLAHLPVPNFSTLSRRSSSLAVKIGSERLENEKISVSMDSTGLKVYGEGEWKVGKHGTSKRRTWRKLHLCININTQEIIDVQLTANGVDDGQVALKAIDNLQGRIEAFYGDGAYDHKKVRKKLGNHIKQVIPPPKNAIFQKEDKTSHYIEELRQRDEAIKYIQNSSSKEWKIYIGYHARSLSETGMFRYKTTFSEKLNARKFENQQIEVKIKCKILNKFLYNHKRPLQKN